MTFPTDSSISNIEKYTADENQPVTANGLGARRLRILLVDDDAQALESTRRILELEGYEVTTESDGALGLERIKAASVLERFDLVISDVRMPKLSGLDFLKALRVCKIEVPVILMTAFGQVEDAVWALKHGAVDFLTKPFKRKELMRSIEAIACLPLSSTERGEVTLVGESPSMRRLKGEIQKIAATDVNVVLQGESGCGKDLVARLIHRQSVRQKGPWVAVNCAAMPETLMESEFFGYERGAFTGATSARVGLFEAANSGTLFLDEIAELPMALQAKLLRVLQDQQVQRLGTHLLRKVDVRVICATNRNLRDWALQGKFRQDLLYRLEVVQIDVPSLRDRTEDLPALVDYFTTVYSQKYNKQVTGASAEVLELLKTYAWPGNVRELAHALERAVIFAQGPQLQLGDLSSHLQASARSLATNEGRGGAKGGVPGGSFIEIPMGTPLKDVEELLIRKTLEATDGDKNLAARILGMSSRTIYRKLESP